MKINNIKKRTQIQGGILWTMEVDNERQAGENLKKVITITKDEAIDLLLMANFEMKEYPTPGYRITVWEVINK